MSATYQPDHIEHLAGEARCIALAIGEHAHGAPPRVGAAADRLADAAAHLSSEAAFARLEVDALAEAALEGASRG